MKNTHVHQRLIEALSGMLIHVKALQTQVDSDSAVELPASLKTLEEMARDALSIVRAACEDEPLAELEHTTLAEALSRLVESTAEALGLSSRVSFSGVDEGHALEQSAERILYLIAREALYEVRQHTAARRLRLNLQYGSEEVQMSIEDDGRPLAVSVGEGAPAPALAPPFALEAPALEKTGEGSNNTPIIHDLRSHLEQLGGSLEIAVLVEGGVRFQARLPYTVRVDEAALAPGPTRLPEVQASPGRFQDGRVEEPVTVLLVDSQAVTRAGLHRLLESYAGIRVIGEASDGVQAVSEALELGPQVVLMDTQLPNGQSLEALRQIKQLNQETRVLLLSAQEREEYLYETLRAGADGYVLKDIDPDELAQAVRTVARGEILVQPQLASRLLSRVGRQGRAGTPYETLTARELEVLRLLARGLRNKEIAARLYVSERTVNFHLANIYQKLNVSGRTEAVSKALEQGLITV